MLKDCIVEIDNLKKEIDSYRPLPAPILPMLKEYFRIGLTYTSNALEGNTLTETETKVILEDGLTIERIFAINKINSLNFNFCYFCETLIIFLNYALKIQAYKQTCI